MNVPITRSKIFSCLFSLTVFLSLAGCSTPEEVEGEDYSAQEQEEVFIARTWVINTARVHVLDRMLEVDPESMAVLGDAEAPFRESGELVWETNVDLFLEAGLLLEGEDGYRVDTELSMADAGRNVDLSGDHMEGALGDTLRASTVTWCDEEKRGVDLAQEYYEGHYEDFDTHEEYEEDIVEYVKCGTDG
ncbi:hypothetical protein [Nocardiopsis alba]|uniref:hypothetical protein n=1 Tax=Nocardiopsis alba TaxID=53437 RepID=UPI0036322B4E